MARITSKTRKAEGRATITWKRISPDEWRYQSPEERRAKTKGLEALLRWDSRKAQWYTWISMPPDAGGGLYEDFLPPSVYLGSTRRALDIATEQLLNTCILHLGG